MIEPEATLQELKPRRRVLRAIRRDPLLIAACLLLAIVVAFAVAAPLIAPHDPIKQNLAERLRPPFSPSDKVSWLGADALGRDVLSRIIHGARISMLVAFAAVGIAGTIGVVLGLIAGFYGGIVESVIMRIADVQLSIPFIVLALALVAAIGPGLGNIIIVLGVTAWVPYARVVRAEVLSVKQEEYIEAARTLGVADFRLMWRHILPNVFGATIVIGTIEMARMVIAESSLSFLGLGVPPSVATWGTMVADGRNYLSTGWWVSTLPGMAILLTVVALNIVGDWLSDRANPALRSDL